MKFKCRTIASNVRDIVTKEKGSKFIGYAFHVKDEEEVKKCLEEVKKEHKSATHHCYAYRLGYAGKKYRANDDGEPNGTAGLPIYNQLLSNDLTYILVVVVRYFGGTKLGVSGLIMAYKGSAEETLAQATVKILEMTSKFIMVFPYSSQNDAMRTLERFNGDLLTQTYMQDCELEVEISKKHSKAFLKQLQQFPDIEVLRCD